MPNPIVVLSRTAKDALNWLILIKEELGNDWLNNKLFRSVSTCCIIYGICTTIVTMVYKFTESAPLAC
jgi:hypothetical protein